MKIKKPIKSYQINGLYGEKNITIPFESYIKILVGENGTGKTTVLNILYYLLSNQFYKLRKIPFESIHVEFESGDKVNILKDEISASYSNFQHHDFFRHLQRRLSKQHFEDLLEAYQRSVPEMFTKSSVFRAASKRLDMPSTMLADLIERSFVESINGEKSSSQKKKTKFKEEVEKIRRNFQCEIKYLPTYRRVEEDLINLGLESDEVLNEENVIQFGMKDVQELFDKITSEIKNSSIEWFSKVNGQMLAQLVEGFKVDDLMKESLKDPEALRVVLERIGNNISEDNKKLILKLIESETIFEEHHDPLTYFLSNLIKVYEQQKENDNAIKEFTDVCNKYLVDKKIVYNESLVTISIVRKKNDVVVDIDKLSSGEKQIISLFSKLYLDKTKQIAVFFDEPELSLSMEWQKQLLPHILQSGRCEFLFTTTHSPFIFDNELSKHTSDLKNYIEEL